MEKIKAAIVIFLVFMNMAVYAADWPQFRGPNRDGKSSETNLLSRWPEDGPEMLWAYEGVGTGFSSPIIVDGSIYTAGIIDGDGVVFALDLDGNLKWQTNYGTEWTRSHGGTRSTPTYKNGNLYLMSGHGKVVCLDAATGEIVWTVDTQEEFQIQMPTWGVGESLVVDSENVYCTPGGQVASMVALNKTTGEIVWKTTDLTDESSYCSPLMFQRGDMRLLVTMTSDHVVFIDADNGNIIYKDAFSEYQSRPRNINPVTPVYRDGMVYTTSGYDCGGAMYEVSEDGRTITRIWVDETLDVHHGGVAEIDGYIYGANWQGNADGNWCCLDWQTGEVMYEQHWHNKGSIIYADGHLYCYEERDGNFALVEPTPEGFNVISAFQVELGDGPHWAHPAISDGRLYIRHGNVLMCYDIKAE